METVSSPSSAFLTGKNWPFQLPKEDSDPGRGSTTVERTMVTTTTSSFGAPSSVMIAKSEQSAVDAVVNAAAGLKEPKTFASITAKQAEWERQLESADQKQAELFHYQWSLIKEQLSHLTREMASLRQENENMRGFETRWQVREADFARVVRETQAELEKESLGRRKDAEEYASAFSQIRQIVENERVDRTQALQAIEQDVGEQLQNVKTQQRKQLEADKDLSSRFEHWCVELRATLDKESKERGQKLDELEQHIQVTQQRLAQEIGAREELSSARQQDQEEQRKIDDELNRNVGRLEGLLSPMQLAMEAERAERDAMGDGLRKLVEDEHANTLRLVDQCAKDTDVQNIMVRVEDLSAKQDDILVHHKNLGERIGDVTDAIQRCMDKEDEFLKLSDDFRAADAELKSSLDILTQRIAEELEHEKKQNLQQHSAHIENQVQLDERLTKRDEEIYGDLAARVSAADQRSAANEQRLAGTEQLMQQSQNSQLQQAQRVEEIYGLVQAIQDAGPIPRPEFEQVMQRLWEALDSHTHDVDVAALKGAQSAVDRERQETYPAAPPPQVIISQSSVAPSRSPPVSSNMLGITTGLSPLAPGYSQSSGFVMPIPVGSVPVTSGSMTLPLGVTTTAYPQAQAPTPSIVVEKVSITSNASGAEQFRVQGGISTPAPPTPVGQLRVPLSMTPQQARSVTPVRR